MHLSWQNEIISRPEINRGHYSLKENTYAQGRLGKYHPIGRRIRLSTAD